MAERIELLVEPLHRSILGGVMDPSEGRRVRVDLGVLPVFEDERPLQGLAAFLDWRSGGALTSLVRSGWWSGRAGESVLLPGRRDHPVRRLVLVGLGRRADMSDEQARQAVGRATQVARRLCPEDVLFAMPGGLDERDRVEAAFAGLLSGLHADSADPPPPSPPAPEAASEEPETPTSTEYLLPVETDRPGERDDDEVGPVGRIARIGGIGELRRWWVLTHERHTARLRRLLDGPPRPAEDVEDVEDVEDGRGV